MSLQLIVGCGPFLTFPKPEGNWRWFSV